MENSYYTVDRRRAYVAGGVLGLMTTDPFGRALLPIEGVATSDDLGKRLHELFPVGLSMHGWEYLTEHRDFLNSQGRNYAHYETSLELIVEFVWRDRFPERPSRLQSYFSWDDLEAAKAFSSSDDPIFRVEADSVFRADQRWLVHGRQGIAAAFCASQYWSGNPSTTPRWEFALAPPVRIVERVA
jgi:hypothetical protein